MRKVSIILISILIVSPLLMSVSAHSYSGNQIKEVSSFNSKNHLAIREIKPFQTTTITLDFNHRSGVYEINVDKPGFLTITVKGKSISSEYLEVRVHISTNASFISFLEGRRVSRNVTIYGFDLYFSGRDYDFDSFSTYVGEASTFYLHFALMGIDYEDSIVNLEVEYKLTPTTGSSSATISEGNQ